MRATVLCVAFLAACSTPRVEKVDVPPPHMPPAAPPASAPQRPTDEQATTRFLQEEIQRRSPPQAVQRPSEAYRERGWTDEEATRRFLDEEIRRKQVVAEPPPVRVQERVVYVERPYETVAYPQQGRSSGAAAFPWNTAIGAGVGAIIGNNTCGSSSAEGALIGGSIGLMMDLARWH
ncbi:MAG: hypothetical protein IT458_14890 [Planctomycetes bacterium]|nr:hypothetical protein [Planctomycetota bacterium]